MQNQELKYAGFWLRVGASLIDGLLFTAVTIPLLVLTYGTRYLDTYAYGGFAGQADIFISQVLPMLVTVWFWMAKQATPGKMIFSLKVVDAKTGAPLTVWQSLGRYAGYVVATIPFGLGIFWVALDKKKQGWHDKMAGTVVVRLKNNTVLPVSFEKGES